MKLSFPSCSILATGICCSLGYSGVALTAALRAGMDNFQQSSFVDNRRHKLVTAAVPMDGYIGVTHLATMTEAALKDMMEQLPTDKLAQLNPQETALLIICPEREGGSEAVLQYHESIAKALYKKLPAYKDYKAVVFNGRGRTGGALRRAQELLLGALIQK